MAQVEDAREVKEEAGKIKEQGRHDSVTERAGRAKEGDHQSAQRVEGGRHGGKPLVKDPHANGITKPGTRTKKGSKGHEEEQQPDRTSPRREGRGQEGPSSKGRLQDKRRQKEKGKEQG